MPGPFQHDSQRFSLPTAQFGGNRVHAGNSPHKKAFGMARTAPSKDLKDVLGIPEDCEDPECRAPLNILQGLLSVAVRGKVMNECKDKILKAAKLEEWRYANCPLDKETLGRGTWGLLHNAAIKYPNKPNSLQQNTMRGLIEGVAMFFPCKMCSTEVTEQIKKTPPRTESRATLSMWLCDQHNRVNEKLGKPTFRCEMACLEKRWKKSNEQRYLNDDADSPEYRVGGGDGH